MTKETLPNYKADFIKQLIPQREPMIMVDSIIHYEENTVKAGLTIKPDNIFVQNNEMMETGILEHMAQTVALYTGYQFYIKDETPPTGYIGSMKAIEILSLPTVGQTVETTAYILHEIMGVTLVNIEVYIGDQLIAKGEMKTVIAED